MRTLFRNVTVNRYAFDIELFTMASILHLKVHEMPVIMKIDRSFNAKEIVNMFMDVTRICYRHKVLHSYQKELAVHLPVKVENNESFSTRWSGSITKCYYPSLEYRTSIPKLNEVER